jgi:hypothetical protein
MSRWHSANVIQKTPALSQLWRFSADGDDFTFVHDKAYLPSEPIDSSHVVKNWNSLFRPRLNLAWLPIQHVYLRVIQLPTSDMAEIASMVELQMEKLSPLPTAQVVWGIQPIPKPADKPDALQSVVVVIAVRSQVEEFLGGLLTGGFMSDRLEVPCLDQLLMTPITEDGVWIYLGATDDAPALVAWWYGGVLQNVSLLALPVAAEREEFLKNQLQQMAWAGELEGWLTAPPSVHLIAEPSEVAIWEPLMRQWSDNAFKVVQPIPLRNVAAHCAARSIRPDSRTNLIPQDISTHYHQKVVDGLWMRGLMAVLGVYALGVVVYMAALFMLKHQYSGLQTEVSGLSNNYTNAVRNRERIKLIKVRQELKYAALDCWKAVALSLPSSMTVDTFYFTRGKLELRGTVPDDQKNILPRLYDALVNSTVNGEPIFVNVTPVTFSTTGGQMASWQTTCKLKGEEENK